MVLKLLLLFSIFFTSSYASNIKILTTQEAPTNYIENKQLKGISVDIVNEIRKMLKTDQEIELLPWARTYNILKNGSNVIAFTAGKTKERVDLGFHFIGPITTKKHILWGLKSKEYQIKNVEDIKNKSLVIGIVRDDWRSHYLRKNGFTINEVAKHEQNARKLTLGRVDLFAIADFELPLTAKIAKVDINLFKPIYTFSQGQSYILISKNSSKELIQTWTKAFEVLQNSGFMEKLAIKWSKNLKLEVKYTKDSGFFLE